MLLETYSSLHAEEMMKGLPPFLHDVVDVTGKPEYSMFNLSLRDESYDAKFYKYASTHGNKQQPPKSLSPLNGHNNHSAQSNGCDNRPTSTSPLACSSVSPSSDDVLMTLTSSAIRRAANGHESPRRTNGLVNGSNGNAQQSNGCGRVNGSANGNGHMHLE